MAGSPFSPRRWARRLIENPLLRRVVRNSGYLFSANAVAALLSMGQSALSARLLGVAGFGLLGVITQFATVLNGLTSFRMSQLVVSYVSRFEAKGETRRAAAVFKVAGLAEMSSSLLAYALVLALAPLGARLLAHDPEMARLFAIYGLMVLANLIGESATGLLQVSNRFSLLAAMTVGQSALTLALIAAAFVMRGGLLEVLLAYLTGKAAWALSTTVAALLHAGRRWGKGWWRVPLSLLDGHWRELGSFALNTNLTTSLNLVTRDSELLWLSAFSTPVQVGYYKVALAVRNILVNPVDPLISTTFREVAHEIANRRWANVRYLLRSGSLISAAWTVPSILGLVVLGPWAISLVWGREFVPAYVSLLILLLGVGMVNIFYWNRNVLLPLGLPGYPTRVHLVAALAKIGGIFLIVPRWGAAGMAALLSGFFLGTGGTLVLKTLRELRRAEARSVPAVKS